MDPLTQLGVRWSGFLCPSAETRSLRRRPLANRSPRSSLSRRQMGEYVYSVIQVSEFEDLRKKQMGQSSLIVSFRRRSVSIVGPDAQSEGTRKEPGPLVGHVGL